MEPLSTPKSPTSRPFTHCLPTMVPPCRLSVSSMTHSSVATSAPANRPQRPGRLLGDCPRRSHLHLPSQSGREVARRHGHYRRRRAVLLRCPGQPGGRLRLHPELSRRDRVVAGDRRAHLRGRSPRSRSSPSSTTSSPGSSPSTSGRMSRLPTGEPMVARLVKIRRGWSAPARGNSGSGDRVKASR